MHQVGHSAHGTNEGERGSPEGRDTLLRRSPYVGNHPRAENNLTNLIDGTLRALPSVCLTPSPPSVDPREAPLDRQLAPTQTAAFPRPAPQLADRRQKPRRQGDRRIAQPGPRPPIQQGIWLVEDDAELAVMLQFAFESQGNSVTVHDSGPEALQSLLALPLDGPPRLLLLADDLPGMDGHTLHEHLQRARPGRFVVVFLSVRVSDAEQIRALNAGAVDYIVKPISIPVLLAKADVWLRQCLKA